MVADVHVEVPVSCIAWTRFKVVLFEKFVHLHGGERASYQVLGGYHDAELVASITSR